MSQGFVEVEVKGFREMNELFKQLPEAVGQKVLRKALMKAAQPMLNEVRSRTPVQRTGSGSNRTGGELQKSMKARVGRSKDATTAIVRVGTPLHYGWFVEFGTEFQDPQPFMRPGFYATTSQAIETFTAVCSESLNEQISRARLKAGAK